MIDIASLKNSLIDLGVSGKLSADFVPVDSVSDIIDNLPVPSSKRKKLLGQSFDYGKQPSIPSHWKWVRLGEISSYGDTPTKAYFEDTTGDTWILDLEDIKAGGKLLRKTRVHGKRFIGDKTVFHDGQVLYSKLRPYLKKVLVADEDGISTPELISFDTLGGIVPKYIAYCLLSSFTDKAIDKRSYGIKMPRVDAGFMVNLPVPLPPVSEQKYIVERIEQALLDVDAINILQARYADNRAALKAKLIDAAIQGKLTEQLPEDGTADELYQQIQAEKQALIKAGKIKKEKPLPEIEDEEKPFDIPESWTWVRFSSIIDSMSTGPFGSMLHKDDYVSSGIPLVNPANIVNGKIIPSEKMLISEETRQKLSAYILTKGMIVMGRRGEMGRCALVTDKEDGWLCGTGSFFMSPNRNLFISYLCTLFSTSYAKGYLGGASIGTTMSNLNHTILSKMPVPLPPFAEQKRIIAKLDELLPLC